MIGVLTYNVRHRKTYDLLCLLKAKGYKDVCVYAAPLYYEKRNFPIIKHRPGIFEGMLETKEICQNFEYTYLEIDIDKLLLPEKSILLIAGAGILSNNLVERYRIINSHPGYLPNCRGLDAYKWAVLEDEPIGVTTHLLGKYVDAGEIIERKIIDVSETDTFHTVAQRVYETEISMLVGAIERIDKKHIWMEPGTYEIHKRMDKDNEKKLYQYFEQRFFGGGVGNSSYYVHESSYIDKNVKIGEGTRIWHFCHIQSGARIGKNCTLGQNVYIGRNVYIGNDVKIQNNVSVYEGVVIEDGVFCGPSCVFTNDLMPKARYPKGRKNFVKTLVREGASIGANATIICGNIIGKNAMVAAGAVVVKDVPEGACVKGVPAK